MQSSVSFSSDTVSHIATLAAIPVSPEESEELAKGFTTTMQVVDQLSGVDTSAVEPTHQVTGLMNVAREDVVDESRMFTQEEALRNAARSYNGYFVVGQILDK